jgi:BirA family biotin operon repressor/biotin-[acetyl-CoA-carboxylase] ligase
MDIKRWRERLEELPLGEIYIYQEVESTNSEAEKRVQEGAPAFSLVLADAQTAGRGRQGRSWITQPGSALALSWILYPEPGRIQPELLGRLTGLGAVAVCQVLRETYRLPARVKWPNDVLVEGEKITGILPEVHWDGCRLVDVILGIGVNVHREALPQDTEFIFPATTLEDCLGARISRLDLLQEIMESLLTWYRRLAEPSLIDTWNSLLAYREEQVVLSIPKGEIARGELLGVNEDGSLNLRDQTGLVQRFHSGEIQVRLVDRS